MPNITFKVYGTLPFNIRYKNVMFLSQV